MKREPRATGRFGSHDGGAASRRSLPAPPLSRRRLLQAALPAALIRPAPAAAAPITGLRTIAASRGILFGSMIRGRLLDKDPGYAAMMARECALFVSRVVHFDYLQPHQGVFDFSHPDFDLAWAQAHDMKFRGNALIWGEHVPDWFTRLPTRAASVRAMRNQITRVCRHFAGHVQSWDVVNEAIKLEDGRRDGLRTTAFLDQIGPEYLDIAFHAAREADPKALLVYNEFGIELAVSWQRDRRRILFELLDGFKKRGVPIDAVGIQSHLTTAAFHDFDPKVFTRLLRDIADRGLTILISELDVYDRGAPPAIAPRDAEVAAVYRRYLDVALASRDVKTLVSWGLTDGDDWVNSPENRNRRADGLPARPLPFDADYQPTPAYVAIAEALHAAPRR